MDYLNKSASSNHQYLKSHFNNTQSLKYDVLNPKPNNINWIERETIQISNKTISQVEWETITKLLEESTHLHTLSFTGINIDSVGLKKLSEILSANNKLKTLKLEWNYLNEYIDEFYILSQAVMKNNSLLYLHLNNNKLNLTHAELISKIIEFNSNILQIDLRWNDITDEGAKIISNGLVKNTSLVQLNLNGNKISEEILLEIEGVLNRNRNFSNNSKSNISDSHFHSNRSNGRTFKLENSFLMDTKNSTKKEKDIANEYKSRYESQLINNSIADKKLKDFELLLSTEKACFEDYKKQMEKDLQNEKEIRKEYEGQFLKKNEELIKREFEYKKTITDLEIKNSALVIERTDSMNTIILLKEQSALIKVSNEEKYKLLESQYTDSNLFHSNNYETLQSDYEKIKKDSQSDLKKLNNEWEKKSKSLEEKLKNLNSEKEELEKLVSQMKIEFKEKKSLEIESKEKESKISSDENKKIENLIKHYDTKFVKLNLLNNELKEKNGNLVREISSLRKSHSEEKVIFEKSIDLLNMDNCNLTNNINGLKLNLSRLNSEISSKEELIHNLKKDFDELNINISRNHAYNNNKIEETISEYLEDRCNWEKERQDLNIEIQNSKILIQELKSKIQKSEGTKQKILINLKNDLSSKIDERFKQAHLI